MMKCLESGKQLLKFEKTEKWTNSTWFHNWEKLAKQNYHGYEGGYWSVTQKSDGSLVYKFYT